MILVKVVDASNMVLGRLASKIARDLLNGEEIVVINAEKAVIIGNKDNIIEKYTSRREIGSVRKGPYYPKSPDRILRRTVRGMLPMKKSRGVDAYRRLKVYMGVPKDLGVKNAFQYEDAKNTKLKGYTTLKDLSVQLGAKVR